MSRHVAMHHSQDSVGQGGPGCSALGLLHASCALLCDDRCTISSGLVAERRRDMFPDGVGSTTADGSRRDVRCGQTRTRRAGRLEALLQTYSKVRAAVHMLEEGTGSFSWRLALQSLQGSLMSTWHVQDRNERREKKGTSLAMAVRPERAREMGARAGGRGLTSSSLPTDIAPV